MTQGSRQNPSVCAVVVHYMGADLTRACVESLLASPYRPLRVVIVDNASPDRPAAMFRELFPACAIVENKENLGYTGGANAGIRVALASGDDFALVLNNDTVCDPGMIPALVRAALDHPRAGMLTPKILYHEPPDRLWYDGGHYSLFTGIPRHEGLNRKDDPRPCPPRVVSYITGCAPMIRLSAPGGDSLFDESLFHIAEDLDLCLRMKKAGRDLLYVPDARIHHREGFATKKHLGSARQLYLATRNLLRVHRKHASPVHSIVFYPWFAVRWLLWQSVKHLIHGRFGMVSAMFRGVKDFIAGQGKPTDS